MRSVLLAVQQFARRQVQKLGDDPKLAAPTASTTGSMPYRYTSLGMERMTFSKVAKGKPLATVLKKPVSPGAEGRPPMLRRETRGRKSAHVRAPIGSLIRLA